MKKIIYIILLATVSMLTNISCTEEEVVPQTEIDNGGGGGIEGQVKI